MQMEEFTMNKGLQLGGGGKSSRSNGFSGIKQKIFAFTLAETLIVMGVIGIVSALTLPNLNSSTGEKETVAKVKKIYQNLNDALGRAEAVYGPYEDWFVDLGISDADVTLRSKRVAERLTEFMKVSKDCKQVPNSGCFTSGKVKLITGVESTNEYENLTPSQPPYNIITADGTSMSFRTIDIVIDIDGPNKGPYTYGKDIFVFELDLNYDGVLAPNGMSDPFKILLRNVNPKSSRPAGDYAAAWIIRFDNMDYLKLTDSSGKCPNGTTISEANPRCK